MRCYHRCAGMLDTHRWLNLQRLRHLLILVDLPLQDVPLQPILLEDLGFRPRSEVVGGQPVVVHEVDAVVVSDVEGLLEVGERR